MAASLGLSPAQAFVSSGQAPEIMLSVPGFNDTGGALLFNHPGSIATDGTRLALADRFNNRVLIWHKAPSTNTPPDLVLGQKDFVAAYSGSGLDQMNFPGQISFGGGKLVVADSNNDRLLVWNSLPTTNGQAADFEFRLSSSGTGSGQSMKWPWGVWTDGTRLMATSTSGGKVLAWNSFPSVSGTQPDYTLSAKNTASGTNRFGTPRFIATDGSSYLVVGDHNANEESSFGAFFWSSFPTTENEAYSFFGWGYDRNQFPSTGFKSTDGKFVLFTTPAISIWNSFPSASNVNSPDLVVSSTKKLYEGGDAGGMVQTSDGRIYICAYNGNRIQVFNHLPTSSTQEPDFAVGSPDIYTNTLESNKFITNAQPASDGNSLFVASSFERRVFIWKSLPTISGTKPDYTLDYSNPSNNENFSPVDIDVTGSTLVAAGGNTVKIWTSLPTAGQEATYSLRKIGSVDFGSASGGSENIGGIAYDGKYLYISHPSQGKVYIWNGIPAATDEPFATLTAVAIPGRIASNGKYLGVISISASSTSRTVKFFDVATLSSSSLPVGEVSNNFSLAQQSQPGSVATMDIAWNGDEIYMSDAQNHLVYGWRSLADALAGKAPGAVLGSQTYYGGVGLSTFSRPAGLAVGGGRLWMGEFKFANRLMGFSLSATFRKPAVFPWLQLLLD